MATIHNEKNFKPEDYRVYDYFDNKPPQSYFREPVKGIYRALRPTKAEVAQGCAFALLYLTTIWTP